MSKTMKNIPKLRFPEFRDAPEWEMQKFSTYIKLYRGSSPRPIQNYLTQDKSGVNWIKIGDTKNANNFILENVEEKITPQGAKNSRKVEIGELILANSMSFGKTYELAIEGCIYDGWFVLREYEEYFYKPFLLQLLNSEHMQQQYQRLSAGGIVQNISSDIVNKTILFHTSYSEQQKISECLSSLDALILAQSSKVEALKAHKKALMQQLFPAEGETTPRLRFPEFQNDGEWEEKTLSELLDYERPDNYIVSTTNYGNEGIPVLTANKSFILGYTKEDFGIFNNTPVIIFDDFTTDKKYVDFDFKVKSSAIKILSKKGKNNLRMIFELMNQIKFEAIEHKRYYISEYQNLIIKLPQPKEQQKIADCLSSLDALISVQSSKVEVLKQHKKALMQQLFPKSEDK